MLQKEIGDDMNYTDISHGLGVPFGGFGTGYFVFGRHGFVNFNVDGYPEQQQTAEYPHGTLWDYTAENPSCGPIALYVDIDSVRWLLQKDSHPFIKGNPSVFVKNEVKMPYGKTVFLAGDIRIELLMYSSLKRFDLARTSVPACVIEYTVTNTGSDAHTVCLGLAYDTDKFTAETKNNLLVLNEGNGGLAFGINKTNSPVLSAGETGNYVGAIGWYYPEFVTQGLARDDIILRHNSIKDYKETEHRKGYIRNYTLRYENAAAVATDALHHYEEWKDDINAWHGAFSFPDETANLLFGSYSSVITSSLYTTQGYYFEIEQPHGCLNTMDVSVYSTWLYMMNWPELEEIDLYQYIRTIPMEGETAGKVWHSLWADSAHYEEEAIFVIRVWRYVLWSGNRQILEDAWPVCKAALEHLYSTEGSGALIDNISGNQSYDAWKMPGICNYVNNQWLYALFSFERMSNQLGKEAIVLGKKVSELLPEALKQYNEALWDEKEGYWYAYKVTEKSNCLPFGNAVFSDQLFGFWAASLDPEAYGILSNEQCVRALKKIYVHNRVYVPNGDYYCWLNGALPEKEKTPSIEMNDGIYEHCGYHALCCWICAETGMASLMYRFGLPKTGEDVFYNVAKGIGNNHLAVGEYNRGVDENMKPETLHYEPGKDTPRFPAYPRYKCAWEHPIAVLNLQADLDNIYLNPAKNVNIALSEIRMGSDVFSVTVEKNWDTCLVGGKEAKLVLMRGEGKYTVEFIKIK